MPYRISLSEEAEEDISHAYYWYEMQKKGLGNAFTEALEVSFSAIQLYPEAYSFRKKNIRGCNVKDFLTWSYLLLNGLTSA